MRGSARMQKGLRDLIERLPSGIRMAEIGCYAGESTVMFLESGKVEHIMCVDRWSSAESAFDDAMRAWAGRALKVKSMSVAAARAVKDRSLDFVYIDADHSYAGVRADIRAWRPKVKAGGMIGGHDYAYVSHARKKYGVVRAVHEAFVCPDLVFEDSSWLVRLESRG